MMKLILTNPLRWAAGLLAALMLLVSFAGPSRAEALNAEYKKDFYAAVNRDWLKNTEIPKGEPSVSSFSVLERQVNEQLNKDFKAMASGEMEAPNPEMKKMIAMYKKALDFETRAREGTAPLKPYIEKIEAIRSLADLEALAEEWTLKGFGLPFSLSVSADMKDADKNALYLRGPQGALVDDPAFYDQDNPMGAQIVEAFRKMSENMLKAAGYTDEKAAQIVEKAVAFDKSTVVDEGDQATQADTYHPKTLAEVEAYSKDISFARIISRLAGRAPEKLIVETPAYFEKFSEIVNENTLENVKAWLLVLLANGSASLLSEDYRQLTRDYSALYYGMDELPDKESEAVFSVTSTFGHVVGDYYGRKYFGEKARAGAEKLVRDLIAIHRERLLKNSWLSPETIRNAVKKLDTMHVNVGYAKDYPDLYRRFEVDEKKSYFDIYTDYTRLSKKESFDSLHQDADRGGWMIPAHSANANYNPSDNSITFPAAILQEPFYSVNRSPSENLGGIGAVIAHEITHAFDENGALFDEKGNLNNWWTDKDAEAFGKRTQALLEQWDGCEAEGGKVDGELTLQENIADNGGMAVALEAMKQLKDPDYPAFFRAYASIWREKANPEYAQMALSMDPHAPKKLRCNMVISNFDEFHRAFGIKEGNPMYRAPEKRVQVW